MRRGHGPTSWVVQHVEPTSFRREVPADDWPAITITLRASASVIELARHVVQPIATSRGALSETLIHA